jgi:hypothetical protein
MYLFFIWRLDLGKSITRAIGRGEPQKSQLFGAQMAIAMRIAISGHRKVSNFRAHRFQWPLK